MCALNTMGDGILCFKIRSWESGWQKSHHLTMWTMEKGGSITRRWAWNDTWPSGENNSQSRKMLVSATFECLKKTQMVCTCVRKKAMNLLQDDKIFFALLRHNFKLAPECLTTKDYIHIYFTSCDAGDTHPFVLFPPFAFYLYIDIYIWFLPEEELPTYLLT
jgi:hypothetical protein